MRSVAVAQRGLAERSSSGQDREYKGGIYV
jgi:hypothetical protein